MTALVSAHFGSWVLTAADSRMLDCQGGHLISREGIRKIDLLASGFYAATGYIPLIDGIASQVGHATGQSAEEVEYIVRATAPTVAPPAGAGEGYPWDPFQETHFLFSFFVTSKDPQETGRYQSRLRLLLFSGRDSFRMRTLEPGTCRILLAEAPQAEDELARQLEGRLRQISSKFLDESVRVLAGLMQEMAQSYTSMASDAFVGMMMLDPSLRDTAYPWGAEVLYGDYSTLKTFSADTLKRFRAPLRPPR